MTLVFRSPKLVQVINNENPGPGAYKIKEIELKNNHPSATFMSKVQKGSFYHEENDIGPFTYYKEKSSMQCKNQSYLAVFRSKIQRFGKDKENIKQMTKQKEFAKQFNELMKKQKKQHSPKGKLVDLKLKKEKQIKLNNPQCLPSIPGHEHSYGYRIDYNTNKLVNNYNPKVIFTQNKKSNDKEDFYFQRSHNLLEKSKKCSINMSGKRSQNYLVHQLSNPNLYAYNADRYNTIEQDMKKTHNFYSSLTRFQENSPSRRDLLKINKMKRDFGEYIGNHKLEKLL